MSSILASDALNKVGNTPLVRLPNRGNVQFYAKLEWYNPFGSLKDRPALWMIRDAERRGILNREKTIFIEPTSGNTGIALAGIASALNYGVELIVPSRVSEGTKNVMKELGAKVLDTEDDLCPRVGPGTDQCIALADSIIKSNKETYLMLDQYKNEANFRAHYESTGVEILSQLQDKITHFIAGVGTGGTLTGTSQRLKEKHPDVKVYGVQPQKNHHVQGLRNLTESMMPELLERRANLIDEWVEVDDQSVFESVKFLAKSANIFVGPSSGAVYSAATRIAEKVDTGTFVLIFGDDGRKFESIYEQFKVFSKKEFEYLSKNADHLPKNIILEDIETKLANK